MENDLSQSWFTDIDNSWQGWGRAVLYIQSIIMTWFPPSATSQNRARLKCSVWKCCMLWENQHRRPFFPLLPLLKVLSVVWKLIHILGSFSSSSSALALLFFPLLSLLRLFLLPLLRLLGCFFLCMCCCCFRCCCCCCCFIGFFFAVIGFLFRLLPVCLYCCICLTDFDRIYPIAIQLICFILGPLLCCLSTHWIFFRTWFITSRCLPPPPPSLSLSLSLTFT